MSVRRAEWPAGVGTSVPMQSQWWLLYAGKEGAEGEAASLLARERQGDPSAFDEIVRRYQTRVYNLAYRMLRTREEAEDVTQEAFLKAFQSLATLRAPEALGAWIGRIASTLCLARLRSPRYRRERAAEGLAQQAEEAAKPEDDLARAVQEAVAQLP